MSNYSCSIEKNNTDAEIFEMLIDRPPVLLRTIGCGALVEPTEVENIRELGETEAAAGGGLIVKNNVASAARGKKQSSYCCWRQSPYSQTLLP